MKIQATCRATVIMRSRNIREEMVTNDAEEETDDWEHHWLVFEAYNEVDLSQQKRSESKDSYGYYKPHYIYYS